MRKYERIGCGCSIGSLLVLKLWIQPCIHGCQLASHPQVNGSVWPGTFQTVGKQKPGGPQRNTLRRTQLTVRQICHLPKRFRAHVEKGEYVLEVDGKPLVGVVPPWQVEKLSQRREEILALLEQSWEQNRTVGDAEVKQAVKEAIEEVRREKMTTS